MNPSRQLPTPTGGWKGLDVSIGVGSDLGPWFISGIGSDLGPWFISAIGSDLGP